MQSSDIPVSVVGISFQRSSEVTKLEKLFPITKRIFFVGGADNLD